MSLVETPKLVMQPTPTTCVHACMAMVTGQRVETFILEYGEHGMSGENKIKCLVRNNIYPLKIDPFIDLQFYGIYLIAVPSLNIQGASHSVVAYSDPEDDEWIVLDPNNGRKGKKFYNYDALQSKAKLQLQGRSSILWLKDCSLLTQPELEKLK